MFLRRLGIPQVSATYLHSDSVTVCKHPKANGHCGVQLAKTSPSVARLSLASHMFNKKQRASSSSPWSLRNSPSCTFSQSKTNSWTVQLGSKSCLNAAFQENHRLMLTFSVTRRCAWMFRTLRNAASLIPREPIRRKLCQRHKQCQVCSKSELATQSHHQASSGPNPEDLEKACVHLGLGCFRDLRVIDS